MKSELTAERLREVLHYEPKTGVFRWVNSRGNVKGGDLAGSAHKHGYLTIRLDRVSYLAHRLAWLWVHGSWPLSEIDHLDGNPKNNAISNLRDVPRHINCQNKRVANRDSRTGFLGVCRVGDSWKAQIGVNGHHRNLGKFATPQQAHKAYLEAKRSLHPGYVPSQSSIVSEVLQDE